jgi:hypothetical protein
VLKVFRLPVKGELITNPIYEKPHTISEINGVSERLFENGKRLNKTMVSVEKNVHVMTHHHQVKVLPVLNYL